LPGGLNLFAQGDDAMFYIHVIYQWWMRPARETKWFMIWDLPGYKPFAQSGREPTKQEMRELTLRFWAISRLVRRESIDPYFPTQQHSRESEKKIAAEIKRLPQQKWQRLWQRAGLSHLKTGRSGPKKTRQETMDKSSMKNGIVS
jgi:hypothetical protein